MKKFNVGDKVVVNNLPDTTVYIISEIDGFICKLDYFYPSGERVGGGTMDMSILRKPTKKQMENYFGH